MGPVKSDIRELTAEIKQWCDEVYPTRTRDHMIAKLREEFQEFLDEPLNAWEMADIMIIMLDLADCLGFDLPKIISHKMDINRNQRTWTVKDGILKHDRST